jgi:hypothetical protein
MTSGCDEVDIYSVGSIFFLFIGVCSLPVCEDDA